MTIPPAPHGLQDWYLAARDGELDGIRGARLDPCGRGWTLHVDLAQAGLQGRDRAAVEIRRTGDDWICASADGTAYRADCGALSLTEAINGYLAWAALRPAGPPL